MTRPFPRSHPGAGTFSGVRILSRRAGLPGGLGRPEPLHGFLVAGIPCQRKPVHFRGLVVHPDGETNVRNVLHRPRVQRIKPERRGQVLQRKLRLPALRIQDTEIVLCPRVAGESLKENPERVERAVVLTRLNESAHSGVRFLRVVGHDSPYACFHAFLTV